MKDVKQADSRPQRFGWAPGGYISECVKCGCHFIGDKRAVHCADCAYSMKEKETDLKAANDNRQATEKDLEDLERAIDTLVDVCHRLNAKWWIDPATGEDLRNKDLIVPTKMLLIVSEITEAMEADRKDQMDDKLPHLPGVVVELADALIRIGDLAGAQGWKVGAAAREKSSFNLVRPDHKHENRVKAGGKKY